MPDQATHLRQLVRDAVAQHGELAPGAPLIVATGGAPGVGATTAACGLARELARLGKQVILVDANLARPGIAQRCNIHPDATLADILAGRRRAVETLVQAEGVRILPGVPARYSPQLDQASLAHLLSELAALCRQSDAVILDAGAGMTPWTDRLWQAARHVLLVTTAEDAALVEAYAALKQSHHLAVDGKVRLVVNRTLNEQAAAHAAARFATTCRRFLGITPQGAATLPAFPARSDAAAIAAVDNPFARAARTLAADLACDVHAIASAVRSPMSKAGDQHAQFELRRATDIRPLTSHLSSSDS